MLNASLQQAVAGIAGVAAPRDLHLVQCSSTGATGAIIFHGWVTGERQPRVVVKTPRDARLHHALQREWDAVTSLQPDPRLAELIPAAQFAQQVGELDPNQELVIHCKSGGRSGQAVQMLKARGFTNARNLTGGVLAWIDQIDPSQSKY